MIQRSIHVLAVQDLQASIDYYQDVLGFTIHEIGDAGWRMFEHDSCRIMVGHCPGSAPARELGDHAYFAYLILDDVDSYYSQVTTRKAQITKCLRDEPWGMREFGLQTNDGHRIMFGQETG